MSALTPAGVDRPSAFTRVVTRVRVRSVVAPIVVAAILVAAWAIYAHNSAGHIFPDPAKAASGFWSSLKSSHDWSLTLTSWRSLLIGYAISAPLGILIGMVLGGSRILDRTLGVYLDVSLVVPMIVLMPIVLIALGITAEAEVVVIIFFAVPYAALPVRQGVRTLPKLWIDLGKTLGGSRWQFLAYIVIPAVRASIVDGLRLGLAHAVDGLFVVELTLAAIGIGQVVLDDEESFKLGAMFGYLGLVLLQVLVVMAALALLRVRRRGGVRR